MGNTLKEQGKFEEAIIAFNKATSIEPSYAKAHNNMGNALQEQGKLEEAIKVYNKAIAVNRLCWAYNNMGNVLQEQGKLEEAIKVYTKAISINPDYSKASHNIALSFYQIGKYEEAASFFKKINQVKVKLGF